MPDISGTLSSKAGRERRSPDAVYLEGIRWALFQCEKCLRRLSNHLLANSLWELGWCYEWTFGCVEFPALPQISGVSLDKPSKVALSLVGRSEVTLLLKEKR